MPALLLPFLYHSPHRQHTCKALSKQYSPLLSGLSFKAAELSFDTCVACRLDKHFFDQEEEEFSGGDGVATLGGVVVVAVVQPAVLEVAPRPRPILYPSAEGMEQETSAWISPPRLSPRRGRRKPGKHHRSISSRCHHMQD